MDSILNNGLLIASVIISSGALLVSFLNYKNALRLQNENQIYNLKVELYTKIIKEAVKYTTDMQDKLNNFKNTIGTDKQLDSKKINDLADEVDKIGFAFDDFIVSNVLIVPKKILAKLTEFDSFILHGPADGDEQLDPNPLVNLEKFTNILFEKCNELVDAFREDLHIDKLNNSLLNRLKRST